MEAKYLDNELSRAKQRYQAARKKVHKHPHAALMAQRACAQAALKKINCISIRGTSAQGVLTRTHSLLGRFNPGESRTAYEEKKQQHTIETMTWLKFKLLVNRVQIGMHERIEQAWKVAEIIDPFPNEQFPSLRNT